MHTVLIVDDHPVIHLAVRILLEKHGSQAVAETGNDVDAIQLVRKHELDVVILDIGIPRLDGLTVISRVKSLELRTQVLVLTSQSTKAFYKRCIQVGARGFINKEEDLDNLINTLNIVIASYALFPSLTFDILDTPPERISESGLIGLLSDCEIVILQHLAMGYSNRAIGEKLFLSNKTVSTYKTRLLQELGLGSLIDLAEFVKHNSLTHRPGAPLSKPRPKAPSGKRDRKPLLPRDERQRISTKHVEPPVDRVRKTLRAAHRAWPCDG